MGTGLKAEIPARRIAEILGIVALLLWRIYACPLAGLWRDWVTLLAVYWIVSIALTGKRAWAPATTCFMLALMTLYLWGQMPFTLTVLRNLR
jgi:hypothetical protein